MSDAERPRWIEYMPLTEVRRADRNPKNHATEMIRESMKRFGVVETPAIDERTGQLVAGHGRLDDWKAARDRGEAPPEGVIVREDDGDWLVPVSRGWRSADDAEAAAYLITSNNTVIMGGWDTEELDKLLAEIAQEDFGLAQVTGASAADLESLLSKLEESNPIDAASLVSDFHGVTSPLPPAQPASYLDDPPIEHEDVPSTDARYAETEDEEATRAARIASYERKQGGETGLAEVILVYPLDDRAEVVRLISAAREVLGRDLKGSEIVLRSLRTLMAVLDERHNAEPVHLESFAKAAGWTPDAAE